MEELQLVTGEVIAQTLKDKTLLPFAKKRIIGWMNSLMGMVPEKSRFRVIFEEGNEMQGYICQVEIIVNSVIFRGIQLARDPKTALIRSLDHMRAFTPTPVPA
jgi:hypothetical protein